ncbi:hypothetical protein PV08_00633 [Exophiala spinifera]|uniref:Uncharacterized protein n=1 Tax=Exophiala spinifera TaxID=91928 RepID=A0A0D2BMB3_9EURO|nr:uncharacterized protein PV08_00633 [Exophiala spinifera]KIW20058.1 hypothetical protein PV08_00633 [Exophiala spinifera]
MALDVCPILPRRADWGSEPQSIPISRQVYVIAAFEDAVKLVQRIQDQRETGNGVRLPKGPTRDLLESLALGPAIVRGHYEHDLKRFGEQYACGDIQAREGMKDILINLQMTLIITLRTVYMDNMDLDFNALQTTSDNCRVNAGVCLGQLSQRLSEAVRAQAHHPTSIAASNTSGLMIPLSPSIGYSSSRSTFSSSGIQAPLTPPPSMADQFGNMSISKTARPSYLDRNVSAGSPGSQDLYGRQLVRPSNSIAEQHPAAAPPVDVLQVGDAADEVDMRRRSSQALASDDNILMLFPAPGGQLTTSIPSLEADKDPSATNGAMKHSPKASRGSSSHRSQNSRDRYGPDDYDEHLDCGRGRKDGRQYSNSTVYDMYNPPISPPQERGRLSSGSGSGSNSQSYSSRAQTSNHGTLQHVHYLQENSRPRRSQPPRTDSLNTHPARRQTMYDDHLHQSQQSTHWQQSQASSSSMALQPPLLPRRLRPLGAEVNAFPNDSPQPDLRRHPTVSLPTLPPTQALPQAPTAPQHPQQHQHQHPLMVTGHLSPSTTTHSSASIHSSIYSDRDHDHHSNSTGGPPPLSSSSSIIAPFPSSSGPLILPTDKDTLGFCRGAFRLQAGLERKAFTLASRPVGFTGTDTYWRCEKCHFEGPQHTSINVSSDSKRKGKPERSFDPRIRTSEGGGVRYKWVFLARCHVQLKGMVPVGEAKDGSFGSFGCIFCCAEGKYRGWTSATTTTTHHQQQQQQYQRTLSSASSATEHENANENAKKHTTSGTSTNSPLTNGENHGHGHGLGIFGAKGKGKTKSSSTTSSRHAPNSAAKVVSGGEGIMATAGTTNRPPIFGNVASFMQHLERVHRPQEGWPNAEMLGRFKVVVGRLAGVHEDGWDINFVPYRE